MGKGKPHGDPHCDCQPCRAWLFDQPYEAFMLNNGAVVYGFDFGSSDRTTLVVMELTEAGFAVRKIIEED